MINERVDREQEMHDRGMSSRAIARAFGVSKSTVYRYLNPAITKVQKKVHDTTYRAAHKLEIKIRDAAYYASHKVERATYCAAHKSEIKAYNEAYYVVNKATWKAYYVEHRKEIAEYHTKYLHEHLPEYAARSAKRRALIAGTLDNATPKQLAEIVEIYRIASEEKTVRCYLCLDLIPMGEREVDHIYPVSEGGSSLPSNLAVAHMRCNRRKAAKMPVEIGLLC